MNNNLKKLLALLLTAIMAVSFAACGQKEPEDPNKIVLDSCELLYKGARIMKDTDGNDAVVLTLDFTNKSKDESSYLWSVNETAKQGDTELDSATVFIDPETYENAMESQFESIAAGETIEVMCPFVLIDTETAVEVTFSQLLGKKSGTITVDLSQLESISAPVQGGDDANIGTGDALLDWWNGEWYGWWTMTGCGGYYEGMSYQRWDIGGVIEIGEDYQGLVTLWDVDYSREAPTCKAEVSLNAAGTGEHGTMMSEGGWFTDVALEHANWIVDPGLLNADDMICIDGDYENGDDEYHYEIYLRPWGMTWDDIDEEDRPAAYDDWYLPMINADKALPDTIGGDAPVTGGDSSTPSGGDTGTPAVNVGGGDGLVTEEQVQKGYVWMNKVAKDIFNTTYEELVAYFGVEGAFVKEEYSDHMKANYRYYKWISKDDSSHFIYVNFSENEPGVYTVSAFNTSGFSGKEATEKYLDIVKAEAAEADKAAAGSAVMKDFSVEVKMFAHDDVKINIKTTVPESGWSYDESKRCLVENDDPTAFGAGSMRFEVRTNVSDFDFYEKDFENYKDIDDRVIGGITFQGRTYKYIGLQWIEYVAQIDDGRALSIGLRNMDCVEGTMPDIILNNMKFK